MFVRFESIAKPNSYNDSPITSLSFMQDEVSREQSEGRSSGSEGAVPDLQSPTTMHHHHFAEPAGGLDLNNNGSLFHHQQHNHSSTYSRSIDSSDSMSYIEDDSAKELFAKVMSTFFFILTNLVTF